MKALCLPFFVKKKEEMRVDRVSVKQRRGSWQWSRYEGSGYTNVYFQSKRIIYKATILLADDSEWVRGSQ